MKAIASARVKTDKIDARILAHLLRTDLVPEAWAPPAEVRELRDLVRLRWRFVAQRATATNRISNLLARQCLRFEGTDPFGRAGRAWLAELELDAHGRTLIELLLATIDEADAHVCALTALLRERLAGAPEVERGWKLGSTEAAERWTAGGRCYDAPRRRGRMDGDLTLTAASFSWKRIKLTNYGPDSKLHAEACVAVACRLRASR